MWSNILPIFAIIVTGSLLRSINYVSDGFSEQLRRFASYFCAPALILISIGSAFYEPVLNWKFIGVLGITTAGAIVVFTYLLKVTMEKSMNRALCGASSITLPRVILLGLPLVYGLFGRKALIPAAISLVVIYVIYALTIFVLELMVHKNGGERAVKKCLQAFFCQSVIIAAIIGYLYSFTAFTIPDGVVSYLKFFEVALIPVGLFAFGAQLNFKTFSMDLVREIWPLICKLVVMPGLVLWVGYVFDVNPMWLVTGVLFSALPTCHGAIELAKAYAKEGHAGLKERIHRIYNITSVCAVVTLFFWVLILAQMYPNLFRFVSFAY